MSDERRWDSQATFDALAFGLANPVRVWLPAEDSPRWRERCSICGLARAECSAWEAHAIKRRQAYAEARGLPYDLLRCGRCGEPVGALVVQRDGLRYCDWLHAEPDTVLVYVELAEELVGTATYGGGRP